MAVEWILLTGPLLLPLHYVHPFDHRQKLIHRLAALIKGGFDAVVDGSGQHGIDVGAEFADVERRLVVGHGGLAGDAA